MVNDKVPEVVEVLAVDEKVADVVDVDADVLVFEEVVLGEDVDVESVDVLNEDVVDVLDVVLEAEVPEIVNVEVAMRVNVRVVFVTVFDDVLELLEVLDVVVLVVLLLVVVELVVLVVLVVDVDVVLMMSSCWRS